MNVKIKWYLVALLLYPPIVFSADARFIAKTDSNLPDVLSNSKIRGLATNGVEVTDIREIIGFNKLSNKIPKRFNNNKKYNFGENCNAASSSEACSFSNLLSTGTTDSYIDEYNMFAVVGTGIRLPEEQIESFNGIDD